MRKDSFLLPLKRTGKGRKTLPLRQKLREGKSCFLLVRSPPFPEVMMARDMARKQIHLSCVPPISPFSFAKTRAVKTEERQL